MRLKFALVPLTSAGTSTACALMLVQDKTAVIKQSSPPTPAAAARIQVCSGVRRRLEPWQGEHSVRHHRTKAATDVIGELG